MPHQILRRDAVERLTGLKRSSIYAKIASGEFPRPIQLSKKAVGWLESDIAAWQDRLIAQRDGQQAA
jgi:prophage regulatory protein